MSFKVYNEQQPLDEIELVSKRTTVLSKLSCWEIVFQARDTPY